MRPVEVLVAYQVGDLGSEGVQILVGAQIQEVGQRPVEGILVAVEGWTQEAENLGGLRSPPVTEEDELVILRVGLEVAEK